MFLYINIEFVNEEPIGKYLTLGYQKQKCRFICVSLTTKMLRWLQKG